MAINRARATAPQVERQIEGIQAYYDVGRQTLQQSHHSLGEVARSLKWSEDKLRKARQLARPVTGYSPDDLQEVFALLREHRPVFGPSHLARLVSVPWPERKKMQRRCIQRNWSVSELATAIRKELGRRSQGGRKRRVRKGDVLIQLDREADTWIRLVRAADRSRDGLPPVLDGLSPQVSRRLTSVTGAMQRLQEAVLVELADDHAAG
jgi:hypothetical protein